MSKQTSVEWLQQEYELNKILTNQDFGIGKEMLTYQDFEQAKEMHKQEIIDAYYQCGRDNFEHIKVINRSATEYYQETFKKD